MSDVGMDAGILDDKGRCCGRKPILYKQKQHFLFCPRCDRAYDATTKQQIDNWAYTFIPNYGWRRN